MAKVFEISSTHSCTSLLQDPTVRYEGFMPLFYTLGVKVAHPNGLLTQYYYHHSMYSALWKVR